MPFLQRNFPHLTSSPSLAHSQAGCIHPLMCPCHIFSYKEVFMPSSWWPNSVSRLWLSWGRVCILLVSYYISRANKESDHTQGCSINAHGIHKVKKALLYAGRSSKQSERCWQFPCWHRSEHGCVKSMPGLHISSLSSAEPPLKTLSASRRHLP